MFKEMFKEQQNTLINIVSQNTTPLQTYLDKWTIEIKENNDQGNNIMKETDDLKLIIETYQNITDDKLKDTENWIDKIKETFNREIEKLKMDTDETNNKLRILEDRSRRDNLRFDDIEEWEEKSWADTEQNLKDTLSEIQIHEDFLKVTVEIWKKNWEKVKELRDQNKYAILVYDKIYTTDCNYSF